MCEEEISMLWMVLQGVMRYKLYARLAKIPNRTDSIVGDSMEERVRWLSRL